MIQKTDDEQLPKVFLKILVKKSGICIVQDKKCFFLLLTEGYGHTA